MQKAMELPYLLVVLACRLYLEDPRILTTLSVLLGIDLNPSGDSMDIDPPAHSSPPKTSPKQETKPETNENLTDDQIKVRCWFFIIFLLYSNTFICMLSRCRHEMRKSWVT